MKLYLMSQESSTCIIPKPNIIHVQRKINIQYQSSMAPAKPWTLLAVMVTITRDSLVAEGSKQMPFSRRLCGLMYSLADIITEVECSCENYKFCFQKSHYVHPCIQVMLHWMLASPLMSSNQTLLSTRHLNWQPNS